MQVLSENCSNKVRIGNIRFRRQVQAICLLAIGKIPAKLAKKWSLIFKTFLVPFQIYYNWLQLIFNTLLPLSSLIGMNIQIYLTIAVHNRQVYLKVLYILSALPYIFSIFNYHIIQVWKKEDQCKNKQSPLLIKIWQNTR